jgi:hypothetical protein
MPRLHAAWRAILEPEMIHQGGDSSAGFVADRMRVRVELAGC